VLPLQILFSATFFLSIGTLLDVRFLLEEPLLVLAAVVLVLVGQGGDDRVWRLITGCPVATAASTALLLAQWASSPSCWSGSAGKRADAGRVGGSGIAVLHRRDRPPPGGHPGLAAAGRTLSTRLSRRRQPQHRPAAPAAPSRPMAQC
jgi:hypothetical protein